MFWQEEKFLLLGEEYSLGSFKPVVLSAKLVNEAIVRTFIDQGLHGQLRLEFVPGNDGTFTKEYVNWSPSAKEQNMNADDIHINMSEH